MHFKYLPNILNMPFLLLLLSTLYTAGKESCESHLPTLSNPLQYLVHLASSLYPSFPTWILLCSLLKKKKSPYASRVDSHNSKQELQHAEFFS